MFFRTNGQASSGLILLIIKGGMDKHTSRKAVLEIISWTHAGRLGEASLIKKKVRRNSPAIGPQDRGKERIVIWKDKSFTESTLSAVKTKIGKDIGCLRFKRKLSSVG